MTASPRVPISSSPRLVKPKASPRRLPPLIPAAQIERETADCLRLGLDRSLRKQFVPPPGGRMLGPSLSKLAATVGPYTSEQRENAVHIESTARYTLANEAAHEALRLKARTRTSDVFFVEAAEAREAAVAARAAKMLALDSARKEKAREGTRAALDSYYARLSPRHKGERGVWCPP